MRKILFIIIPIFLFSFVLSAQPVCKIVDGDTVNWGVVVGNAPLTTSVLIVNDGTDTLEIIKVKPGCGCTNAPINKTMLISGDTATIDITLSTGKFSGELTKEIEITTNDSAQVTRTIILKANIVQPITIYPPLLVLNNCAKNETITDTIVIKNNTIDTVTISDFVANSPSITLQVSSNIIMPNTEGKLIVMIAPTKKESFRYSITFRTTIIGYELIEIPVFGRAN